MVKPPKKKPVTGSQKPPPKHTPVKPSPKKDRPNKPNKPNKTDKPQTEKEKGKKKGKGRKPRPGGIRPTKDAKSVSADLDQGKNLWEKHFGDRDELAKITNNYANQEADALNQYKALSDPHSSTYAGARAGETKEQLAMRKALSDPNSPTFAGRRSSDVTDILGRMKGGLEGYSASENNAMRESMNRVLDQNANAELKSIQDSNAGNMVLGGAATAREDSARKAASRTRAENEQDLFVKNVDEKRSRLDAYGNAVQGAESDEYGRGFDAMNAYEGSMNTAQTNEWNKSQMAMQNYQNYLTGLGKKDIDLQGINNDITLGNNKAYIGGVTGTADLIGAEEGDRENDKRIKDFLDKMNGKKKDDDEEDN